MHGSSVFRGAARKKKKKKKNSLSVRRESYKLGTLHNNYPPNLTLVAFSKFGIFPTLFTFLNEKTRPYITIQSGRSRPMSVCSGNKFRYGRRRTLIILILLIVFGCYCLVLGQSPIITFDSRSASRITILYVDWLPAHSRG